MNVKIEKAKELFNLLNELSIFMDKHGLLKNDKLQQARKPFVEEIAELLLIEEKHLFVLKYDYSKEYALKNIYNLITFSSGEANVKLEELFPRIIEIINDAKRTERKIQGIS